MQKKKENTQKIEKNKAKHSTGDPNSKRIASGEVELRIEYMSDILNRSTYAHI